MIGAEFPLNFFRIDGEDFFAFSFGLKCAKALLLFITGPYWRREEKNYSLKISAATKKNCLSLLWILFRLFLLTQLMLFSFFFLFFPINKNLLRLFVISAFTSVGVSHHVRHSTYLSRKEGKCILFRTSSINIPRITSRLFSVGVKVCKILTSSSIFSTFQHDFFLLARNEAHWICPLLRVDWQFFKKGGFLVRCSFYVKIGWFPFCFFSQK